MFVHTTPLQSAGLSTIFEGPEGLFWLVGPDRQIPVDNLRVIWTEEPLRPAVHRGGPPAASPPGSDRRSSPA